METVEKKLARGKGTYPKTKVASPVQLVSSDPEKVGPHERCLSEMVQLADLFSTAISQSIARTSSQTVKLNIAELLVPFIEDIREVPWMQRHDLHRVFTLACYPNPRGEFYNPVLKIRDRRQPNLF